MTVRLVILISGEGSNLQALLDACRDPAYGAEVVAVGADRDQIAGLDRAAAAGVPTFVERVSDYPDRAAWDRALTARVAESLKRALGKANVAAGEPSMGGEDFSRYGLAGVPICMYRLGAVNQQRLDEFASRHLPPPSLHSAQFYPNAGEALKAGIPGMAAVAIDLLAPVEKAPAAENQE